MLSQNTGFFNRNATASIFYYECWLLFWPVLGFTILLVPQFARYETNWRTNKQLFATMEASKLDRLRSYKSRFKLKSLVLRGQSRGVAFERMRQLEAQKQFKTELSSFSWYIFCKEYINCKGTHRRMDL